MDALDIEKWNFVSNRFEILESFSVFFLEKRIFSCNFFVKAWEIDRGERSSNWIGFSRPGSLRLPSLFSLKPD